jgi:hypothetical protein
VSSTLPAPRGLILPYSPELAPCDIRECGTEAPPFTLAKIACTAAVTFRSKSGEP